jgi:vacuolar-type H+-ATPase catalytic subunit A/Vma1
MLNVVYQAVFMKWSSSAEYFLDQGMNVSMMADSTWQWAEAFLDILELYFKALY